MRDARILQAHAGELPRAPGPDHPLVERCAAASVVLMGGATHGTHEFHDLRAQVTRRLVEDHGFHAVAIEGSRRLPRWVWRHRAVQSFVDWLHDRRVSVASGVPATTFVGLDRYDLDGGEEFDHAMLRGEVTATDGAGVHPHRMRVLEAIPGSYEELFHAVGRDRFWLSLADEPVREALSDARLERAIGVAYHPEDERARHYFGASLAHQFDIVCHIDRTSALEPDDQTPAQDWEERHGADRRGPLRGPETPRLAT